MKLWKVSRTDYIGYDEYDRFICSATTLYNAARVHPNQADYGVTWCDERVGWIDRWGEQESSSGWTSDLDSLEIEYLGMAAEVRGGDENGTRVIMHSFRAG